MMEVEAEAAAGSLRMVTVSSSVAVGAPAVRLGRRVAEMEAAAPSGAAPESSSAEKAVKLVNQMGEAARVADLAGPSLVTNTLMTLPI